MYPVTYILSVWTWYGKYTEYFTFLSQISAGWKNADDFQLDAFYIFL